LEIPLDRDAQMLCAFGLTPNQARVYLTVCRLGIAQVGRVSKASKVRREDIYRLLPSLEKLGLIEKVLGTPTKIRAIPVEDALSLLVKQEEDKAHKKMAELKMKKDEFLKVFKASSKAMAEEVEGTEFSFITEKAAIINKATLFLKKLEREVDIVSSRLKLTQMIGIFSELFKKALKKGVRFRVITEMPEEEDQIPRIIEERLSPVAAFKLRYAESLPSHYLIVDNKEMMITTSTDGALAERPTLWTNSASLIEPLQRTFEELWHKSIDWASIKAQSETDRATQFIKQLKPSEHIIFVYETPEAKYNVLFNYIKCALEKGEAALYVCSEASPRQLKNAMKNFGIDVEKYEKADALKILPYDQFYIIDGKFSITNTLNLWSKYYKEALAKGFKGLRVTGETACFFKHNMVQDLVEYEKALHRVLDIPMIAICSYQVDRLNEAEDPVNLYHELTQAHGTVLFAGIDNKLGKIEIRKA